MVIKRTPVLRQKEQKRGIDCRQSQFARTPVLRQNRWINLRRWTLHWYLIVACAHSRLWRDNSGTRALACHYLLTWGNLLGSPPKNKMLWILLLPPKTHLAWTPDSAFSQSWTLRLTFLPRMDPPPPPQKKIWLNVMNPPLPKTIWLIWTVQTGLKMLFCCSSSMKKAITIAHQFYI